MGNAFITHEELNAIFSNKYLHELSSFYIIESDGTYRDDEKYAYGTEVFKMVEIQKAYQNGSTILVKNLENWKEDIQKKCLELGAGTNAHLYISPLGGSAFDWHTDDRDVLISMQMGEKIFELRDNEGKITRHTIKAGESLHIPCEVFHRGLAQNSPSIHVSFGTWPKDVTIKDKYPKIDFSINIL